MRLVTLTSAAGLELARDVPGPNPGALPLLRHGSVLRGQYLRALADAGVRSVWVHDDLSDGIAPEPPLPEPVRAEAERAAATALADARAALGKGHGLSDATLAGISRISELITASLGDDPHALSTLSDLAASDNYTHRHSVGVTVAGLLVGRAHMRRVGWRDWRKRQRGDGIEDRLVKLGLGLMLHDVGKMAVPPAVLHKPGKLDEHEWQLVREHPDAGVRLLGPSMLPPTVVAVVRSHHERFDGTGYPAGLAGEGIHAFARVAAVADVFDAITSDRPYAAARPPHVGVEVIHGGSGTHFDPQVVEAFAAVVMPYPVGSTVELPDGREAAVAAVSPDDPYVVTARVRGTGGAIETVTAELPRPGGAAADRSAA
jgi:HD-GYP domain-containing protein (c-di-GMP phosphodiesterase class II)